MTSPDLLEPFTARVTLAGVSHVADPQGLVAGLLEDIARRCEVAGSSLIGHIKCHVQSSAGSFHCNLTSRRGGARCAGVAASPPADAATASGLEMDLAVLVYGLAREAVEASVRDALAASNVAEGGEWRLQPAAHAHHRARRSR